MTSETLHRVSARNVREYRRARGPTLDALAAAAGISRRMLIMIEGGTTNPSVAALDRLGQALGVGLSSLVGLPAPNGGAQVIAPDAMPTVWRGAHPESAARLAVSLGARRDVEVWDWRLAPGEAFTADVDPPGTQKLLFVLDGVPTVRLADGPLRVPAGHGARIPGDRPHGYEKRDDRPLHFVGTVVLGTFLREPAWGPARSGGGGMPRPIGAARGTRRTHAAGPGVPAIAVVGRRERAAGHRPADPPAGLRTRPDRQPPRIPARHPLDRPTPRVYYPDI